MSEGVRLVAQSGKLGVRGTMVSGATRAPCYLLAAAAYISPGYNPSPKSRPDEGDPAVLCTSHMALTRKGNKGKVHKMEAVKVDRVNVNVPLGEPPLYSVKMRDSSVRHGVRRRRAQPSGGRIGKRGRPGRTRGASDRSLSLKAQARKSTEKEPELEKITVATPKKKEMCTKGMTCKPGDELEVEVRGKDTVAEVVPSPPLLLSVRHASDVVAVRDCS